MPYHLLLDAARMNSFMDEARELNPEHASLYRNKRGADEILPEVAPFLFSFPYSADFTDFVIDKGWGDSWGLWVESKVGFDALYDHFRRFLMVQTEEGKKLYFRFYDPRVLRIFLPTCDAGQLKDFFGPISRFVMEDEGPEKCITFSLIEGKLLREESNAVMMKESLRGNNTTSQDPSYIDPFRTKHY